MGIVQGHSGNCQGIVRELSGECLEFFFEICLGLFWYCLGIA